MKQKRASISAILNGNQPLGESFNMSRRSLLAMALVTMAFQPMLGAQDVDYTKQIKPLLTQHCIDCHGPDLQEGGFRIETGGLLMRGGDRGVAVVAGKPDESLLLEVLQGKGEVPQMPLDLDPLSNTEIQLIRDWIVQGAKMSEAEASTNIARRKSDHLSLIHI